ncbi:hypothetical protein ACP70R_002860 [Stipagrostis hirtigluma subsp. patula]
MRRSRLLPPPPDCRQSPSSRSRAADQERAAADWAGAAAHLSLPSANADAARRLAVPVPAARPSSPCQPRAPLSLSLGRARRPGSCSSRRAGGRRERGGAGEAVAAQPSGAGEAARPNPRRPAAERRVRGGAGEAVAARARRWRRVRRGRGGARADGAGGGARGTAQAAARGRAGGALPPPSFSLHMLGPVFAFLSDDLGVPEVVRRRRRQAAAAGRAREVGVPVPCSGGATRGGPDVGPRRFGGAPGSLYIWRKARPPLR